MAASAPHDPIHSLHSQVHTGRIGVTAAAQHPAGAHAHNGLPTAAMAAPVGVLGAASAAAWAVHRRVSRDEAAEQAAADEDEE